MEIRSPRSSAAHVGGRPGGVYRPRWRDGQSRQLSLQDRLLLAVKVRRVGRAVVGVARRRFTQSAHKDTRRSGDDGSQRNANVSVGRESDPPLGVVLDIEHSEEGAERETDQKRPRDQHEYLVA
eukprot:GHVU01189791.1.p4 GENE.GHVU01189791.1~~GHVU01189791.1.p4  ORF type:complete len:124 (-),score=11.29 GHVU01189791.1:64-435(-)